MTTIDSFKLLLVEDEAAELNRLERTLSRLEPAARILRASDPISACNQFRRHHPEVVVLDLGLSGSGPEAGLEVVAKISSIDHTSRIVVLTGYTSEEVGVKAVQSGAASFLTKPVNMTLLHTLIRDYAQTARLRRSRQELDVSEPLPGFVGNSAPMQNVYRLIRQCAKGEANVLIIGETGTGKELVANAVHQLSPRHGGPLSVYFGAVPASMAEAELFGYVRGAFTGASPQGSEGAIAKANSGTLFIDELCSLDLDVQRKLLRSIEEKNYKPLGAGNYLKSDFRLVCAAQPRVYDLVRRHQFREDLLGRVEVITVNLPPLRERRDDILPLAETFQKQVRDELLQGGVACSVWGLSRDLQRAFREYSWPRNVRELKHVIHHGMIRAQLRGSDKVDLADVADRLESGWPILEPGSIEARAVAKIGATLRDAIEQLERQLIADSLARHSHVLSAVCQELGLGRTTLWRKLRQYGIEERA
jgi:DNA-binding NtrC family response regulator